MPLLNTQYSTVGSINPPNATGVSYLWTVDGNIISGQSTNAITYEFTTTGSKSVTFTAFNDCSTQSYTQSFNVCEHILGLTINGATTAESNSIKTYSYSSTSGTPVTFNWLIDPSKATILSGQGTATVDIQFNSDPTGSVLVILEVTDCDGTITSTTLNVTKVPACIPITSVSF